jgi:multidrug resistance protein, MATE family
MPPQNDKHSMTLDAKVDDTEITSNTSSQMSSRAASQKAWTIIYQETVHLLHVAIPTVLIQLGCTFPPAMTASYVGRHLGSVYLDGFTLAILTGNLLTLALLWGLYSASDTLSPQAYGAGNYAEVGRLAVRGMVASLLILLPINFVLVFVMEDLLLFFGEAPEASRLAAEWYRVYTLALPFYALYMVLWKFLSAQEIMMPILITTILSAGGILPLALHWFVPRWGFMGSAAAMVLFQVSEPLILILYLIWKKPHHPETLCWKNALEWEPFRAYLELGAGGMLASAEWIWWEFISLIIGTLGIIPLGAHTIPTQVLTMCYMLPFGIGTALAIRLGSLLPVNVPRARQLVFWCSIISCGFFIILSWILFIARYRVFAIFSKDPLVLEATDSIWWKVVVYFLALSVFGIVTGVAVGLGMQWTLGWANVVFLWFVALPGLYVSAIHFHGGLSAAWSWIYPPYLFMNVILIYRFYSSDWNIISLEIRRREGMDNDSSVKNDFEASIQINEHTPLMP